MIYIGGFKGLVWLTLFLLLLIPIYAIVFYNMPVNYDNLLLGMLSGLMLNQQFDNEKKQKRHLLRLLGVSHLSYYGSMFIAHFSLYIMFAGYICLRVQFWQDDQYNKIVYVCSRVIVGLSVIPLVYIMGHFLKGLKNAEMYTVLILYFTCWLFYNGFIVWQERIYECLMQGFPYSMIFYMILLNPFIYVIELSTMQHEIMKMNEGNPIWIIILNSLI